MARTSKAQIRLKLTKPWAAVSLAQAVSRTPEHRMIKDVEEGFEAESDLSVIPDACR
jgi:hypothetical protein